MSDSIKERPIILSAQEVNAGLAGDKKQHRVPVLTSEQVATGYKCCYGVASGQVVFTKDESDKSFVDDGYISVKCPLGEVSDRLWVQEEHRPVNWSFDDGEVTIEYRDGTTKTPHYLTDEEFDNNPNDDYPFAVVDELLARNIPIIAGKDCFDFNNPNNLPHWRSADVMPRFASRLLLEITDIRIERMNDIGEDDAIAEGIKLIHSNPADRVGPNHFTKSNGWYHCSRPTAAEVFKEIYKVSDDYDRYGENPWVWVVEFKVIEPSED